MAPVSKTAQFQSIMEARAGGRGQLHFTFFPCVPSSLGSARGKRSTVPHGHDTSGQQAGPTQVKIGLPIKLFLQSVFTLLVF